MVAVIVESSDEFRRAGSEFHLVVRLLGALFLEAFEQRRAVVEALCVADLVVHRSFGDVGHLVGDPFLLSEKYRHLRVRERSVEIERDEFHGG